MLGWQPPSGGSRPRAYLGDRRTERGDLLLPLTFRALECHGILTEVDKLFAFVVGRASLYEK
jgi:hypothetical protein